VAVGAYFNAFVTETGLARAAHIVSAVALHAGRGIRAVILFHRNAMHARLVGGMYGCMASGAELRYLSAHLGNRLNIMAAMTINAQRRLQIPLFKVFGMHALAEARYSVS